MCGIIGLHLRDPALYARLGELMTAMLDELAERGPDAAGVAVYGDPVWSPPGQSTVTTFSDGVPDPAEAAAEVAAAVSIKFTDDVPVTVIPAGQSLIFTAAVRAGILADAVEEALPHATLIGSGEQTTVLKGAGSPRVLAADFGLTGARGWQGVAHTRMATESAVTPAHSHPFSVGADNCFVHNGSFSNHATIRRELQAAGVVFDSDNDSEVGARFIAARLEEGFGLEKALHLLCERFDGFYTLLVATAREFAVVRDAIACKPAVIAETPQWVAVASEYRALARLPGIEDARLFEPEPEVVYAWQR